RPFPLRPPRRTGDYTISATGRVVPFVPRNCSRKISKERDLTSPGCPFDRGERWRNSCFCGGANMAKPTVVVINPILIKTFICIGFVCAICMAGTVSAAQDGGVPISTARTGAIHECATSAAKYPDYAWGNFEMFVYRACMTSHAQHE